MGVGVDAEAIGGAGRGAMQGAGAALLTGVIGVWHEAEQHEHLGDRDGVPQCREVESGARRVRRRFQLLVAGLPQLFAAFAGFGKLAVACGMDGRVVAEEFVVGRDVPDSAVRISQWTMKRL